MGYYFRYYMIQNVIIQNCKLLKIQQFANFKIGCKFTLFFREKKDISKIVNNIVLLPPKMEAK
jgi:hypothetical protein